MSNINDEIKDIKNMLIILQDNIKNIENKIDKIEKNINNEVIDECKKMGSHIDFVENVYENVKHPLGYISNKIKLFIGNKEQYSLTDNNNNINNININNINNIEDIK